LRNVAYFESEKRKVIIGYGQAGDPHDQAAGEDWFYGRLDNLEDEIRALSSDASAITWALERAPEHGLPQQVNIPWVRAHQSYLVNPHYIRSFEAKSRCLVLDNETQVPVSRTNIAHVKDQLAQIGVN
jgi:hypothetical protein